MLSLRASPAGSATYGYNSYPSTEAMELSARSSPNLYVDRALSNTEYADMQSARAADKLARERVDRTKAQQDEFTRRAEAIFQRKRAKHVA